MSEQPEQMTEEIERYLLELMDASERERFEARVSAEPALAAEVRAFRESLATWALSTPMPVSPALKTRVMAAAAPKRTDTNGAALPFPGNAQRRNTVMPLLLALAASMVLIVKLALDLRTSRNEQALASANVAVQQELVARRDSLIATLTGGDVDIISLASTGQAKPVVRAWLDRANRRAMVTVSSMPAAEAGKAYQLWFIIPGEAPIPSVAFGPDASGRAFVGEIPMPDRVASAGEIVAAITVEVAGGSPTPTTAPIFVGKSTK